MVRLELCDRDFNIIEYLDSEKMGLKWAFSSKGGCSTCSFTLPRKYGEERNVAGDFNIKIHNRNASTGAWDLWYQGFISTKGIKVLPRQERMPISVIGYMDQLSRIHVDRDYTNQEVSVIVKHVLDNEIVPNTDITYSSSDIDVTTFTPNSLEFNSKAKDVIQTLADLVNYEYGVDKDRKFYFKKKSTIVGHRYPIGKQCTRFVSDDVSKEIVNRVIIKGGDVSGSPFTATYNDFDSQRKWGRRDEVFHNTSIVTSEVAKQYADVIFSERAGVVRRGYAGFINVQDRFEASLPLSLFELIHKAKTYGEVSYGTHLYSGKVNYSIGHINYKVTASGAISADIEIGRPEETPGDTIATMEARIKQLQSQGM